MTTAAGTSSVTSWDESTYQDLGENGKLTRATVAYALEGDLTAEATWDAVMCYRPDGTAVFTGMQRVAGQLDGREGTFVVQADGEFAAGEARSRWQVVDGSGTGGLAGLTGTGSAVATSTPPGTFSFDYDLA
jgi:sulfur carrier protein ThiS